MEIKIHLQSKNSMEAVQTATHLKNSIDYHKIPEIKVQQIEKDLPQGVAASGLLESIISIFVTQNVISKLLDIIKMWMESNKDKRKRNTIEVEFTKSDGVTEKVVLKDIQDAEDLFKQLEEMKTGSPTEKISS
jgi:hypothetical protein